MLCAGPSCGGRRAPRGRRPPAPPPPPPPPPRRAALAGRPASRRASLRGGHDQLVVLDLDTGADKARVDVPSPSQAYLFPAPGSARVVYYQSLTPIARVTVAGRPRAR